MICATCSSEFEPVRSDQKHCNTRCRNVAAMRAWRARRGAKRTWPERACGDCGAQFAPTHQRVKSCPGCREEREKARRQKRNERSRGKPKLRRNCVRLSCGREFVTVNPDRWFCKDNCRWRCAQKARREFKRAAA